MHHIDGGNEYFEKEFFKKVQQDYSEFLNHLQELMKEILQTINDFENEQFNRAGGNSGDNAGNANQTPAGAVGGCTRNSSNTKETTIRNCARIFQKKHLST